MAGGIVQPDMSVAGDMLQANRDINYRIKIVFKEYGLKLGNIQVHENRASKPIDPEILTAVEKRYRQRLKKQLPRETTYYVPLSGKTIELSVSPEAKRRLVRPEYQEWIQTDKEIKRALAQRQFIDHWTSRGNRFMVTCRVLDYGEELSGLKRIEIVPLKDEQIRAFLEKELPDAWERMWQKLSEESTDRRRLLEMVRNPCILTMMIDVFKKEGQMGRNRADLINRSVNILIGWAERKYPPEEWLAADVQKQSLSVLAFEIQSRTGTGTKS